MLLALAPAWPAGSLGQTAEPRTPGGPDVAALASAAYRLHSVPGIVRLERGAFRTAAVPGSASEVAVTLTSRVVHGVLDGRSVAAVVLAASTGGSGTFYELAVMATETSEPRHVATIVLGDRVQVQALELRDDEIVVDLLRAGPDDPLCCPTRQVVERYALRGSRLGRTAMEERH